jgi:hypothetical protein
MRSGFPVRGGTVGNKRGDAVCLPLRSTFLSPPFLIPTKKRKKNILSIPMLVGQHLWPG